jgi:hypothetical protein
MTEREMMGREGKMEEASKTWEGRHNEQGRTSHSAAARSTLRTSTSPHESLVLWYDPKPDLIRLIIGGHLVPHK